MHHYDQLPRRLLLILAGTEAASLAAVTLTRELRRADVPALLVTPEELDAPADLRLACARSSLNFFNRRAWLKRLHPDLVLGADLSRFTRHTLLAARSEGLSSMLWSACGERLPWWGRLLHRHLPRIEGRTSSEPVARYLRAELLGLGAGVERLLVSPMASAGAQALAVKRS